MTHDEVKALSVEELRTTAAQLARWRRVTPYRESQPGAPGREITVAWEGPNGEHEAAPPDHPRDIAAAWELVEALIASNKRLCVEAGDDGTWVCLVFHEPNRNGDRYYVRREIGNGATAPLAITRAFVLAMSNEAH